jgi:hypothetical protein
MSCNTGWTIQPRLALMLKMRHGKLLCGGGYTGIKAILRHVHNVMLGLRKFEQLFQCLR